MDYEAEKNYDNLLFDEVKNIVLPELDRRAAKTDSETTGDDWRQSLDWPGGI